MKQTLYSKFITAYIFLGILGTVLISTLGSSLIQKHILEDTGAALYKEAISLASYQANTDYSDNADVEAAYNQLKTLSAFQDSRILILNQMCIRDSSNCNCTVFPCVLNSAFP